MERDGGAVVSWFRSLFGGEPPAPPIRDLRNWNEDWRIGDIAECVTSKWHECVEPWNRPALGARFTVLGFKEGTGWGGRAKGYFLKLEGWPVSLSTCSFRKVRPVAAKESAVVERILTAKPGKDRVRKRERT